MIIGKGDIASVLKDRKDRTFFASGVSNSAETRKSEYEREVKLLVKQDQTKKLVYFSSLGVFNTNTKYMHHKIKMEEIVIDLFPWYTIVRLGNIDWGTNPNTLINHLKAHPEAEIRDEWRYICNKEEFLYWVNLIPNWNCEMNIPGRRLKVQEIYNEYVADNNRQV